MQTSTYNPNLLHVNQSNKEMIFNENMNILDRIMHPSVKSKTSTMPVSPNYGDIYIVPADNIDWPAPANSLALFLDEWIYINARAGMIAWIEDMRTMNFYNGENWRALETTS